MTAPPVDQTPPKPVAAPQQEIGYAQMPNWDWWLYQDETTPELIWPQSIVVYDSMRRTDAQVRSVLQAMTLPVRSTPWRVDPNGSRDEVSEFVADNLGLPVVGAGPKGAPRTKDRFSWSEHLRLALLMLPFGHMFFEQVYRVDEDGNRAWLRKLGPRLPKSIERIDVADDGGLISIQQYWVKPGKTRRPIPVDRLVGYVMEREGGNWLGQSILRPAYKNWLLKDRLLRVWAQTIERNGMGIPLYTGAEGEQSLGTGLAMAKAWRAGESAGSAVPFGANLVLRGVEGTLPDADPAVRYHDEQIGRAVLAHFLNLGAQAGTGSWALGSTFADFFTLSLQALAMEIANTATQHIVEDLVDINFGPDEPAPKIVFDEIGSRQPATAQAIQTLIDAGVLTPDARLEETVRQQYGLPPSDPDTARDTASGGSGGIPSPNDFGDVPFGAESVAAAAGDDEDDVEVAALAAAIADFLGEVRAARVGFEWDEAKHPRDSKGQFRTVYARVMHALQMWSHGQGDERPLGPQHFTREQIRLVATKHRGLKVRRGASHEEIEKQLEDHVRDIVRARRDGGGDSELRPSAKFTLQGPDHRDLDVAVYRDKDGRPLLFRESDAGKRGGLVERFDSLDAMHAWAEEHDEPRLAQWADKERGGVPPAPAAKKTPAKKAAPAKKVAPTRRPNRVALARQAESLLEEDNQSQDWTPEQHRDYAVRLNAMGDQVYDSGAGVALAHQLKDRAATHRTKANVKERKAGRVDPTKAAPKEAPETASSDERVAKIASAFHEDWRKTRLQKDGTFEPRVKKTKDQAWIDANGTDEVDIANTSYDDLPDDWKAENRAAAEVVEGILRKRGGKVDLSDEATRQAVGEEIHKAWLGRNSWAAGGELDVPFKELPADEQAKDIDQIKVAMAATGPAIPAPRTAPAPGASSPTRADVTKSPSRKVRDLSEGDRLYVFLGRYGAQAKAPEAGTHGLDPDPRRATVSRITPDGRVFIRTDSKYEGELLGPGGAFLRPNQDTVRIIPGDRDVSVEPTLKPTPRTAPRAKRLSPSPSPSVGEPGRRLSVEDVFQEPTGSPGTTVAEAEHLGDKYRVVSSPDGYFVQLKGANGWETAGGPYVKPRELPGYDWRSPSSVGEPGSPAPAKITPPVKKLTAREADALHEAAGGGIDDRVQFASNATKARLRERGLIDGQDRITEDGRAAFAAHDWPETGMDAADRISALRNDPDGLRAALDAMDKRRLQSVFAAMRLPEPGMVESLGGPNQFRLAYRQSERADAPALRAELLRRFAHSQQQQTGETANRLRALADEIDPRKVTPPAKAVRKAVPRKATTPATAAADADRAKAEKTLIKRYVGGESIQQIATSEGKSYSSVHTMLTKNGVQLRQRGGSKRTPAKAVADKATPSKAADPVLGLYTKAEVDKLGAGLDKADPATQGVINAEGRRRVDDLLAEIDQMIGDDGSDRALLARLDARRDTAPTEVVDDLVAAVQSGDRDRIRQVLADIRARMSGGSRP